MTTGAVLANEHEIEIIVPPNRIPIHEPGTIPELSGFEEIPGYAVGAYVGGFDKKLAEDEARCDAVTMVAKTFKTDVQDVLRNYEIRIIPGVGFHGRIFARKR